MQSTFKPLGSIWRRYNVFISSTFKDMDVERDIIKFKVIPALNNRFWHKYVEIKAVDLRLGINTSQMTEEQSSEKIIRICANCIDSSRPFFIGLVGNRYGWIPPIAQWRDFMSKLPAEDQKVMKDTFGRSITELEMVYGALTQRSLDNSHALFYLRDESSYNEIPKEMLDKYFDTDIETWMKLEELKERISSSLHHIENVDDRVTLYHIGWDSKNNCFDINDTDFATLVYRQLSEQIEKEIQDNQRVEATWWVKEKKQTEAYLDKYIGNSCTQLSYFNVEPKNLLICGYKGLGMSTLLAHLRQRRMTETTDFCLTAIVGLSDYSWTMRAIMVRWCIELEEELNLKRTWNVDEYLNEKSKSFAGVCDKFYELIEILEKNNRKVSVFIDDVDMFRMHSANDMFLSWLVPQINAVLTCTYDFFDHPLFLHAFQLETYNIKIDEEDIEHLVNYYGNCYRLELPETIVEMLKQDAESVSFIRLFYNLINYKLSVRDFDRIRSGKGEAMESINKYLTAIYKEFTFKDNEKIVFSEDLARYSYIRQILENVGLDVSFWCSNLLMLNSCPWGVTKDELQEIVQKYIEDSDTENIDEVSMLNGYYNLKKNIYTKKFSLPFLSKEDIARDFLEDIEKLLQRKLNDLDWAQFVYYLRDFLVEDIDKGVWRTNVQCNFQMVELMALVEEYGEKFELSEIKCRTTDALEKLAEFILNAKDSRLYPLVAYFVLKKEYMDSGVELSWKWLGYPISSISANLLLVEGWITNGGLANYCEERDSLNTVEKEIDKNCILMNLKNALVSDIDLFPLNTFALEHANIYLKGDNPQMVKNIEENDFGLEIFTQTLPKAKDVIEVLLGDTKKRENIVKDRAVIKCTKKVNELIKGGRLFDAMCLQLQSILSIDYMFISKRKASGNIEICMDSEIMLEDLTLSLITLSGVAYKLFRVEQDENLREKLRMTYETARVCSVVTYLRLGLLLPSNRLNQVINYNMGFLISKFQKLDASTKLIVGLLDDLTVFYYDFLEIYKKKANRGNTYAQIFLGCQYLCGLTKDFNKAICYFSSAASLGSNEALFHLASCNAFGKGVERNMLKAFAFYYKAATQGHLLSQYRLAKCYFYGKGTKKNIKEAIGWFQKAALEKHAPSFFFLGKLYENGEGVNIEKKKAFEYYLKAATMGIAAAQYRLGICYQNGIGIEQDVKEAVWWFNQAAAQNYMEGIKELAACYVDGRGVVKNIYEAIRLLKRNVRRNHAPSLYAIADIYCKNKVGENSFYQGVKWLFRASELGDNKAQHRLALMFASGGELHENHYKMIKYYYKSAEAGNVVSQYRLGVRYFKGNGVLQDDKIAAYWFKKAAEQKHLQARTILGRLYALGRGVEKNIAEAIRLYRETAEEGSALSQYRLGVCYYDGVVIGQNYGEAFRYMEMAALQGNVMAQKKLADFYEWGYGVEVNIDEAIKWYLKAAEKGDSYAQSKLGDYYYTGKGVKKNEKEALGWYRKAARQGDASAQYNVGIFYLYGISVYKEDIVALGWIRKAANQGYPSAEYAMGTFYEYGDGSVQENLKEAFEWYLKAGKHGLSEAQSKIGLWYSEGKLVEQNYQKAYSWFLKSANQGNAVAQRNIGLFYYHGYYVSKNDTISVSWIQKAALQEDAQAEYIYGLFLEKGIGEKDELKAIEWYKKSAEHGYKIAKEKLKKYGLYNIE